MSNFVVVYMGYGDNGERMPMLSEEVFDDYYEAFKFLVSKSDCQATLYQVDTSDLFQQSTDVIISGATIANQS